MIVPGDSPLPEWRCQEGQKVEFVNPRWGGDRHTGQYGQKIMVGRPWHILRLNTRAWGAGKDLNVSVFFSLPICCLVEAGERGSRWTCEVFTGLGAAVPEVPKAAWITSMASV